MIIEKTEIEITSVGGSSTGSSDASPKRDRQCNYYVQSPSRDSNESLTNSTHTTPTFTSPNESPSRSSPSRSSQSRSSQSRISSSQSAPYRAYATTTKLHHHHHSYGKRKGWPPLYDVIDEEHEVYDYEKQFMQSFRVLMILMAVVMVFTACCFITWNASRPYKLLVGMKSWKVNNFYYGEGSDRTGVPTKLLTVNCTVKMNIQNPATFFGLHVSSTSLHLLYSRVKIGSGQIRDYYQPKKSRRTMTVNIEGRGIPLYGAGSSLARAKNNGHVPLQLEFEVRSQANLIWMLVKTEHRCRVVCSMDFDSEYNKVTDFNQDSCTYG